MIKAFHWQLCKEIKCDHSSKYYMHNPESVAENETPEGFLDTNGSPNLGQTSRSCNNLQKKRVC